MCVFGRTTNSVVSRKSAFSVLHELIHDHSHTLVDAAFTVIVTGQECHLNDMLAYRVNVCIVYNNVRDIHILLYSKRETANIAFWT